MICGNCSKDVYRGVFYAGIWRCYECTPKEYRPGEKDGVQKATWESREGWYNQVTTIDGRAGVVRQENPWINVQRQLAGFIRNAPPARPTLDRDENSSGSAEYWSSGRIREVEQVRSGSVVPQGREGLSTTISTSELVHIQSTNAPETTIDIPPGGMITIRNDANTTFRVGVQAFGPSMDQIRAEDSEYADAYRRARSLEI